MTEANPIILDPSESLEEPAKDSSEPVNSSDATRNAVASFTKTPKLNRKGQLQAKNWFLTFPQTTTTKEEASEAIKKHPKLQQLGIKGFMISQETHKDQHKHLHIALWLNKTLWTTDKKFFDFVCK